MAGRIPRGLHRDALRRRPIIVPARGASPFTFFRIPEPWPGELTASGDHRATPAQILGSAGGGTRPNGCPCSTVVVRPRSFRHTPGVVTVLALAGRTLLASTLAIKPQRTAAHRRGRSL